MSPKTYDAAPAALPLLVRAALPAVPVVNRLPGVRHEHGDLPSMTAVRTAVRVDGQHLSAYEDVCGFPRTDHLPATYPHNQVHGLVMALMTDTAFPFAPMGAVHLRNSVTAHRPVGRNEVYDLAVEAAALRPHPKGSLVEFDSRATVDGELVWEETMTVLFRGRRGSGTGDPSPVDGVDAPAGVIHWRLGGDLGRRFARVSGDYNPIHLSAVTARPFGFPRQIAHGMWSKARCLAALSNRLPDAFTAHVEFRKPVLLPTTVIFGSDTREDGSIAFGVTGAAKPQTHLVGLLVPA